MTGRYDGSGNFDIIIHAARAEPRRCNLTRPVLQIDMEAQDVLVGRGVEVVRLGVEQVGGGKDGEVVLVAERGRYRHCPERIELEDVVVDGQRANVEDGSPRPGR